MLIFTSSSSHYEPSSSYVSSSPHHVYRHRPFIVISSSLSSPHHHCHHILFIFLLALFAFVSYLLSHPSRPSRHSATLLSPPLSSSLLILPLLPAARFALLHVHTCNTSGSRFNIAYRQAFFARTPHKRINIQHCMSTVVCMPTQDDESSAISKRQERPRHQQRHSEEAQNSAIAKRRGPGKAHASSANAKRFQSDPGR